jgi:hypothetical protein
MKKISLLFLIVFEFNVFSQGDYKKYARSNQTPEQYQDSETEKKDNSNNKSLTLFETVTFKVGDSISVGVPSAYLCCKNKVFDYIKELELSGTSTYYVNSNINTALTKFLITNVYKENNYSHRFDEGTDIIEFGSKGLFGKKYYAAAASAILHGELMISPKPYYHEYQSFSDSLAFLFKVKTSKNPTKIFSEEALYRFHYEDYEKYKNDEFDFNGAVNKAFQELEPLVTNLSYDETYSTRVKMEIGNYDFQNSSFPINGWGAFEFGTFSSHKDIIFTKNNLVFINPENFSLIPVPVNMANNFIKRRKDEYGLIDRSIFAKIFFKIVNLPENSPASEKYRNGGINSYIFAKIIKIELYDFKHCMYNFLGYYELK